MNEPTLNTCYVKSPTDKFNTVGIIHAENCRGRCGSKIVPTENIARMIDIKAQFEIVDRELFTINGQLDYSETIEALNTLSMMVDEYKAPDDDNSELWTVGEYGCCSLDNLLIGAYWFCSECHNRQNSIEYCLSCTIGSFYTPNYVTGPELQSSEVDAYNALVVKHNQFNVSQLETLECNE